jgi:dynein heavy chain
MKSVLTPGPSIVTSFKLLCLFLTEMVGDQKPKKPNDEKKLATDPEGYWDLARKTVLSNPNKLLELLLSYDREHIPDQLIAKAVVIMAQPEMEEAKVKSASGALVGVRIWVAAMIKYHEVLKVVNPMREIARIKGAELAEVQAIVARKNAEVKAIVEKLNALNASLAEAKKQKQQLEDEMEDCKKKLVRADKMIIGLQDNKVRWTETVEELKFKQGMIVGDCLVASGMVSYAGPFSAAYREALE